MDSRFGDTFLDKHLHAYIQSAVTGVPTIKGAGGLCVQIGHFPRDSLTYTAHKVLPWNYVWPAPLTIVAWTLTTAYGYQQLCVPHKHKTQSSSHIKKG